MDNPTSPVAIDSDPMELALLNMINLAASPEAFEAQTILLRRLALQGDVIHSRVPAPLNITQIGGYLNLLAATGQPEMTQQTLAGILGIAGPNPPIGWTLSRPPLSFVALPNDRPDGPSQPSIPLSIAVRSDFVPSLQSVVQSLHDRGAALPLMANYLALPSSANGGVPPADPLPFLGRALSIVPSTALRDPANDPIAFARPLGSTNPFEIVARVISPGSVAVAPVDSEALTCDATACTPNTILAATFLPVAPLLSTVGFYPATPLTQPANVNASEWSRFTNITGLVAGVTTLGDELSMLYSLSEIASSAFASQTSWRWNGQAFAKP